MANISMRKSLTYTSLGLGSVLLGNVLYRKYGNATDSSNAKGKGDTPSQAHDQRPQRPAGGSVSVTESRTEAGDLTAMTLRQVQVYFRHGARTPLKHIPIVDEVTYDIDSILAGPQDSYFDYTLVNREGGPVPESFLEQRYRKVRFKGGCHAGQLTGLGQQQAYELGKLLHKDYIDNAKLIQNFDAKDVYIRSTNIERTIHSMRCALAGMFGGQELQKKNVEIIVSSGDKEELYPNRFCKVYDEYFKAVLKGKVAIPGLVDFCHSLANHIKYEEGGANKMLNMIDWRDNMVARQAHNLHIPDKLLPWLPKIDEFATEIATIIFSGPKENRKLTLNFTIGRLMNNVQENINKAMSDNCRYHKVCLYSCHDSTLIPILEALNINDEKWPPYAADVRIELYEAQPKQFWVKILYCGKEAIPEGKKSAVMTIKEFNDLIKPVVISHDLWPSACVEEFNNKQSPMMKLISRQNIKDEIGDSETSVMSNKD